MNGNELLTVILGGGISAAVVSGFVQVLIWKMNRKAAKEDKANDKDDHVKKALCVLLYDRIKYLGRCFIEDGSISPDDLEDILKMHQIYHDDLDGNGFLDNLMKQVVALPIRKKRGDGIGQAQ